MSSTNPSDRRRRGVRLTALIATAVVFAMVGAAFAAVPIYRIFCQATGYNGTVRRSEAKPSVVLSKTVVIRFDANVRDLPWDFKPDQETQTVRIGDTGLAFFHVTNRSDKPLTGHASYNVVPLGAGAYFQKLECFCFRDQTLQPGQSMDFPVVYFVDPKFAADSEVKDTPAITLSYTFFPAAPAPSAAGSAGKSADASTTKGPSPLGGTGRAAL
jgi:cytochrome c oxidase assembly protein subunit 11